MAKFPKFGLGIPKLGTLFSTLFSTLQSNLNCLVQNTKVNIDFANMHIFHIFSRLRQNLLIFEKSFEDLKLHICCSEAKFWKQAFMSVVQIGGL